MLRLVRNDTVEHVEDTSATHDRALVPAGEAQARNLPDTPQSGAPQSGAQALANLQAFEREQAEQAPAKRGGWGAGRLFALFVVLPTIAAAAYLYLYASDQYRTETRFIIKSSQKSVSTGLSAILESTGLTTATGDTYAVIDFLESRDALARLQERVPFEKMMAREDADFLARYPGYAFEDNFEALYEHYGRKVEVFLDATTGITQLSVLAFSPEESLRIAEALVAISEEFIDRLNERSLEDSMELASASVARAETRVREAQSALTQYRIENGIVDPTIDVKRLSGLTEGLTVELLKLDQRIEALQRSAPRSPQLNILRQSREKLVAQIGDQNEELAGDGNEMLPEQIARFSELELEAQFAVKGLEAANVSFEKARQETLRKQLYLTPVVEPRSVDDSRDPKRLEILAIVFALLSSAFLILWLLTANMREHAE